MNRLCLLVSCLLACCFGAVRHKGAYSEELVSDYNLPKNAVDKENSMILEEAYPSISRRFYGSSLEGRSEYGAKLGSFNVEHEGVAHGGDYMEPFDVGSMSDSAHESDMLASHPMMSDISVPSTKDYATHNPYAPPHGSYPDHGVVISDSVAKKIGLYDKDYLKKLGLDSKDDGVKEDGGGSGDAEGSYENGLPKAIAKKEKERMDKIGVEDFRKGQHTDDKKQVKHMKEIFNKVDNPSSAAAAAGINYNENGVMVDKALAEKLGLYDKDYLKKLGVWGEKDAATDGGKDKSKSKDKKKDKANAAKAVKAAKAAKAGKSQTHDEEASKAEQETKESDVKVNEDAAKQRSEKEEDVKVEDGSATSAESSGEKPEDVTSAPEKAETVTEDSKSTKSEKVEKSSGAKKSKRETKSSKRDNIEGTPHHHHHHHHHHHSKKDSVAHHPHHVDKNGVKRQLLNFMKPNNNFGAETMEENAKGMGEIGGGQQMMMESQDQQPGQDVVNQNNGMDNAENMVNAVNLNAGRAAGMRGPYPVQEGVGEIENGMNSITGITGGGRRVDLPMNINRGVGHKFKALHMTVGAERAAPDGAIHITAGENAAHIASLAQRGAQAAEGPEMMQKENVGGAVGGYSTATYQDSQGTIQNDVAKVISNGAVEGDDNVPKSNYHPRGNYHPQGTQQTIMDAPHNLNDIYLDGDAGEMSRLERPGNWKIGKSRNVLVNANKPDSLPDMVDKLVPLDKEQGAVAEENTPESSPGLKELPNEIAKGITPSDSDMVNKILKSGDQAVETSEGRGELKQLLAGGSNLQQKVIDDDSQGRNAESLGGGIESGAGIKVQGKAPPTEQFQMVQGGQMPLTQLIPKTLPVLDSMGMIPRRFMQKAQPHMKPALIQESQQQEENEEDVPQGLINKGRNSMMADESRSQLESQAEDSSMQDSQSQVQEFTNSLPQQENEVRRKGVNFISNSNQESGGMERGGYSEMGRLDGEAAGQYARMQLSSNVKGETPEIDMAQRITTADAQQRKEIQTPATGMQAALNPREMKGISPVEEVDNWSQNAAMRSRRPHFHRGARTHSFVRIRSRTGDDQPIKQVDYDDSHSSISIGVKKSAIKKPAKPTIGKEEKREHLSKSKGHGKREKRQYMAEDAEEPPVHVTSSVPYIESAETLTSNMHTNMMGSIHDKVPTLAGMQGENMVMQKQPVVNYYMRGSTATMANKKHHHHKGHKRGDNIINTDNGMAEEMPSEMGSNFGGQVSTPVVGNGMQMGAMNGVSSFNGGPGMSPTTSSEGEQEINADGGMGVETPMEVGKPMMGGFAEFHGHEGGETMESNMESISAPVGNNHGGTMITNVVKHMGNNINGDDKSIDAAMAEEDKIEAETTARNAGKLLQKANEEDASAGSSGSLLKNAMEEGSFKPSNNSDVSESNVLDNPGENGEGSNDEGDSYEDEDENEEGKKGDKAEEGETRTNDENTDLNQEIGDQIVKNNGHMTGHEHMNVVHGTPCTDCHVSGAIGHGAVISGSEAKKIGLNDEAYLKRLGIKECKIKGPGFSEGNHGGAISDEWAKKLDGFDKKYLQQLGIPEEALEGNSATRDCKFVERIAEVLQAQDNKGKSSDTSTPSESVKITADGDLGKEEDAQKAAQKKEDKKKANQEIKTKADAKKLIKDMERLQAKLLDADAKVTNAESKEAAGNVKTEDEKEAASKTGDEVDKKAIENAPNETEDKADVDKKATENKPAENEEKPDVDKKATENKPTESEEKVDLNKNPAPEEKAELSGDGKAEVATNTSKEAEASSDETWEGNSISSSEKAKNSSSNSTASYSECAEDDPLCESNNSLDESSLTDVVDSGVNGLTLLDTQENMIKNLAEEMAITCHDVKPPSTKHGKKFLQSVHDNCTVRSNNASTDNSTQESSSAKAQDVTASAENEPSDQQEESKTKTVGTSYIEALDKNITTENGTKTIKPEDMEFLKRKQTVTHKLKHLEELKTKLKQLNSGILRSKITDDSKEAHHKTHVDSPEDDQKTTDQATRSFKSKMKKLAQKRRRRLHQLKKQA